MVRILQCTLLLLDILENTHLGIRFRLEYLMLSIEKLSRSNPFRSHNDTWHIVVSRLRYFLQTSIAAVGVI